MEPVDGYRILPANYPASISAGDENGDVPTVTWQDGVAIGPVGPDGFVIKSADDWPAP